MVTLPACGLLIPELPQLLSRRRLTDLLHSREYKLIMLVAPMGFGKTSLAREYAAWVGHHNPGQPGAFAWLSLDQKHIKWNVRLFLQVLFRALKHENAAPRLNLGPLELTLNELKSDLELTSEVLSSLIYSFINILADYSQPLLLVLDDFHAISENPQIIEIVNTLLLNTPTNLRILINSRLFPGLDVLRLTMEDQFLLINKGHLRFTREEIAALLILRGKDPSLAERVEKRSEGWAAMVMLSLRAITNAAEISFVGESSNPLTNLFGSLVEETLRNLDGQLRHFLENCSILEAWMDAAVTGALLGDTTKGDKQALAYLSQLEKLGLTEPHKMTMPDGETSKTVYRLHILLKEQLEAGLDTERAALLHHRAAAYYESKGEWLLAFQHYLKINEHLEAAALLENVLTEQFKLSNNVAEIGQYLERLDENILNNYPHLLLVAGMNRFLAGRTEKAIALFYAANRLWGRYSELDCLVLEEISPNEAGTEVPDLRVLVNKAETISRIGLAWKAVGRLPQAIQALEGVVNFLGNSPEMFSDTRRQHVMARTRRTLGACYLEVGRFNECIEQSNKALSGFISLGDEFQAAGCRHNLGVAWRKLGNQAQAERELRNALEYWQRIGGTHLPNTLNSLANGLIIEGRYKEALPLLIEAQSKAKEARYEKLSHYVLTAFGDAYAGLRDWNRALSYYGQAGAEADKQNYLPILIYAQLGVARVYRRSRDLAQSWKSLLKALSYVENGRDSERAEVEVEYGAYQVVSGRFELAQARLEGALALARKVGEHKIEASAHFWLACLYFQLNRSRQAQENMRRALSLAQDLGYNAFLHEEAIELPDFSAFFRAQSSEQILAFFGRDHEEVSTASIQLRAFGKGQILLNGREVRMNSKKARELIFFLLEEKSPVSGQKLAATLWPDADLAGCGLGSGFYSTITHARKALGGPDTVWASGGCYSLNLRYMYDVEEFEHKLNRAERQFDLLARIELLTSALQLYNEDFLSGGDLDWMQVRREALRQKWLKALRLLAEAYTSTRRYEEAHETWLKAMSAEPFDEQPVRAYANLLAEAKSKTIAVNFLRRKIEALQAEGIQPEDETLQLLADLDASRTITRRRA